MELEIRQKIYEKLGLPFGSLREEAVNDWVRALKEVEDEIKQEQFKASKLLEFDYVNCSKEDEEYQRALHSIEFKDDRATHLISMRDDLNDNEIDILLRGRNKDVFISLAKNHTLSDKHIEVIKNKGTYLAKKYLS